MNGKPIYLILGIIFLIFGLITLIVGMDIYTRYRHNLEIYQNIESDPFLDWENPQAKEEAKDTIFIQSVASTLCFVSGAVLIVLTFVFIGLYFKSIEIKKEIKLLCPDCGHMLEKDMKYCPHCGKEIKRVVEED